VTDSDQPVAISWRQMAAMVPQFVQWYIATHGPIPDDMPDITEGQYNALRAEYEKEAW
jgi:hypothetical protein